MSLIAEALKKAEQQQRQQKEQVPAPSPPQPNRVKSATHNRRGWLLSFLLIVVGGGFAGWMVWQSSGTHTPSVSVGIQSSPVSSPAAEILVSNKTAAISEELPTPNPAPVENATGELSVISTQAPAPLPAAPQPILPPLILTGIVRGANPADSFAVLNNKAIREGETIRGETVTAIREKEVDLKNSEGVVQTLPLEN